MVICLSFEGTCSKREAGGDLHDVLREHAQNVKNVDICGGVLRGNFQNVKKVDIYILFSGSTFKI